MRIIYWSTDVCSSDLRGAFLPCKLPQQYMHMSYQSPRRTIMQAPNFVVYNILMSKLQAFQYVVQRERMSDLQSPFPSKAQRDQARNAKKEAVIRAAVDLRSEEHTSELQSLMRTSYAIYCIKKKT